MKYTQAVVERQFNLKKNKPVSLIHKNISFFHSCVRVFSKLFNWDVICLEQHTVSGIVCNTPTYIIANASLIKMKRKNAWYPLIHVLVSMKVPGNFSRNHNLIIIVHYRHTLMDSNCHWILLTELRNNFSRYNAYA